MVSLISKITDLSLMATDMNPVYLDRARAAVYPRSSMREVPEATRSDYFETSAGGEYALRSRIREGIEWQIHHLLSAPPGTAFDLIFLRNNLLTYFRSRIEIRHGGHGKTIRKQVRQKHLSDGSAEDR